ncbi:MAG TPA: GEVED domain-containing protein [Flavipsychrobacter sp.]|nr:GEVED domain-containing protein [Flavipsychrobacter sp.]
MKNMFTLKQWLFTCFVALTFLGVSKRADAQLPRNWGALGCFQNTLPDPAVPNFTPDLYGDGIIPPYIATGNNEYSYAITGATIKIWWSPGPPVGCGNPNPVDTIDKIVFYKNSRPMSNCMIVRYDYVNQKYDTIGYYNNFTNVVADSIDVHIPINDIPIPFPPTLLAVDTIYLVNLQTPAGLGNPDFREIQLWGRNVCAGAPVTDIVGSIDNEPMAFGPGYGPNTITLCPGSTAHMGATSAFSEKHHAYRWQINTGSGWTDIPGATNPGYAYNGAINADFRVMDSCINSALSTPSQNTISVVVSTNYRAFAATGYYMGFDDPWLTSPCLQAPFANDLPNDLAGPSNWSNSPPKGPTSWRIDTTNTSLTGPTFVTTSPNSGWTGLNTGQYSPNAPRYPYLAAPGSLRRYARAHSSVTSFFPGQTANLDMYLNLSTVAGDKALYFYQVNQGATNWDTLKVQMSTNGGVNWTHLATFDTAQQMKRRWIPLNGANSPQTIIRFQVSKQNTDASDIGIDSVFVAAPCSGTPVAGRIKPSVPFASAKTVNLCPGMELELYSLGTTIAGGLVYEWQQSFNMGNTFTPVNGGKGSNSLIFYTPPAYDTVFYRLALKCGPTGTVVYSDTLRVFLTSPQPTYASIPYRQSFETWVNRCNTGDIPASANGAINWTQSGISAITGAATAATSNVPYVGNASWRRHTPDPATTIWSLFNTIGWTNAGYPATPPGGGQYAARFHSNGSFTNRRGAMDLLFNGSQVTGDKELRFYYINTTGNDSLQVYYSADSGRNFNRLESYKTTPQWTQYTLQIPCSSPKCVIRFEGSGELSNQTDIGLDSVTIAPPCVGSPSAGILKSSDTLPCPNETFTLSLQGFSVTGGLSFTWTKRPASSPFWVSAQADVTKTFFTTSITVPTWFKVVVQCKYSGQMDSTEILMNVAPFYYCYCASAATNPTGVDIGNVNIKRLPAGTNLLNNGVGIPQNNNPLANGSYADYRIGNPAGWLPLNPPSTSTYPTPMYHDTSYQLLVSQINSSNFSAATITVWIDTDRNGLFDTDEIFLKSTTSLTSVPPQRADAMITLPASTPIGYTGMRVMIEQGSNINSVPCGSIGNGEVEDYLIEVRDHPCTGPASAGIVETLDTAVCVNYAITLVDTTHATKQYGLRWVWQYSPDSNAWADIPQSQGRDTVNPVVTGQTWYRVRMVCLMTFDTTYSNVVKIRINPPYACYCFSLANGGSKDTSDIGGMALTGSSGKGFFVPSVGPHVLNPWAVKERTDYTKDSMLHLFLDSSYQLLVYHTMSSATHADAKITLFMDINADGMYNITNNPFTNERIWTGFTTSTYFTVVDSIVIPTYGIPGIPTGMRLILNNNTAPNKPSDSACGPYTSGETEDYVIMLHNPANPWWPTTVNNVSNITNLYIYPNPTNGKFYVKFDATKHVDEATIIVTNVTGQQMVRKYFANPGKKLMEEIDLSNLARGVYMVEVKADSEKMVRKLIVR